MPLAFPHCILHIGTEKTGSTTLQTFLGLNRGKLLERGFFVSNSLSPYGIMANHERLTTSSLDEKKLSDDVRRSAGISTVPEVHAHRRKVREDLMEEVLKLGEMPSTLLLSNEHCHSRLVSTEEVQRLHDFLREFADRISVIVYLRPQHELAVSLYDQAMKAGYYDIDVLPRFGVGERSWVSKGYFDYHELLSRWAGVFGYAQITPRLFLRDLLTNGNVIDDFCQYLGCDKAGLARPEDKNRSISEEMQLVLNAFNRYVAHHPDQVSARTRPKLIAALEALSSGPGRRPTKTQASEFFQLFSVSNERVRESFFANRPYLFEIDVSRLPEQPSSGVLERDALIGVLVKAVNNSQIPASVQQF